MALYNRHYIEEFDTIYEALEYTTVTIDTLAKSKRDIKVEKVLIKRDLEDSPKFTLVLNICYNEE